MQSGPNLTHFPCPKNPFLERSRNFAKHGGIVMQVNPIKSIHSQLKLEVSDASADCS